MNDRVIVLPAAAAAELLQAGVCGGSAAHCHPARLLVRGVAAPHGGDGRGVRETGGVARGAGGAGGRESAARAGGAAAGGRAGGPQEAEAGQGRLEGAVQE